MQQMNINMLSRLVSESFWRGMDRLIGERISLVDAVIGGAGGDVVDDWGSRMGSEGDEEIESLVVGVEGSSDFVSVFFNWIEKGRFLFFCMQVIKWLTLIKLIWLPNSFASFCASAEFSDKGNNIWLLATPHLGHTYDRDLNIRNKQNSHSNRLIHVDEFVLLRKNSSFFGWIVQWAQSTFTRSFQKANNS